MDVDHSQAERWIELVCGDKMAEVSFRVIPEAPGSRATAARFRGTYMEVADALEESQSLGCGVFAMVNDAVGGHRAENVGGFRAVWVDLDGFEDVPAAPLEPSLLIRTRSGYHIYYLIRGEPASKSWGWAQNRAMAGALGGDPSACDSARVLRLPGFFHLKGEPFSVEIVEDGGRRYTPKELEAAYPQPVGEPEPSPEPSLGAGGIRDTSYGISVAQGELERMRRTPTGQGKRNHQLFKSAFRCGQMVAADKLTIETAYRHLVNGCQEMGYEVDHGEEGATAVIMRGLAKGQSHPREDVPDEADMSGLVGVKAEESPRGVISLHNATSDITAELDRRLAMNFQLAPSPLIELNIVLGGGAPAGAVSLIGAPPGMGKSSLGLAWADCCASRGTPALYCSLEMSRFDIFSRYCTLRHGMSWIAVRTGKHRDELLSVVEEAANKPLYVLDRKTIGSTGLIRQAISDLSKEYGQPPVVVIDYLQLLVPYGADADRFEKMGEISMEVRDMAQDSGSPILAVTAVNRQSYNILDNRTSKPDRSLALAAAKMSGCLEYDSEAIIGLSLLPATDRGTFGWLCVAKNRSGGGPADLPVKYDGRSGNFYDATEDDIVDALAETRNVANRKTLKQVREAVIEELDNQSYDKADELARALNLSREKVRSCLNSLEEEGVITTRPYRSKEKANV